ncbi:hypothetical protein CHLNCDRAFT_34232 [Chlorella variabilis]|uniref:tRNA-guanine(15) transglycosylase-like domain-containing protein n=1 Tax=Chlorella variabilis TaxID=554065 RepID=E1Z6C2_CHLVA|nr:hypothetical protein CHLNCDRAFT_34232 [Chlorella variabilis]EFN58624.1 hypothetical protein CHLNCDRAFT_34232 [Chlorella variabilis]|eukprot:XP_005850726.1 hypothetical protein CHLNCDRAFT_34232 [Chlorella variabilis]
MRRCGTLTGTGCLCSSSLPCTQSTRLHPSGLLHRSAKSGARVGRIHTPHGIIDTPGFVAVGTNAALKAVDGPWADAGTHREGQQLMFCNTYHLLLHPGADVVEAAGGLHAFMNRQLPLITDSGGFQASRACQPVFSLAYGTVHEEVNSLKRGSGKSRHKQEHNLVARVSEEGVTFRSYRDGARMLLTPESSVLAQKQLGADIIVPLDELPPYHTEPQVLAASLARSHRWMARSLKTHLADVRQQAMYAVVHGGLSLELRQQSIDYLTSLPFDGFAVGGSLGKDRGDLFWLLERIMPRLHERGTGTKPVHILGIADPASIPQLVTYGCDTFDSCYPTRVGRHGTMLTKDGPLRVISGLYKTAFRPPVEGCTCHTCRTHSLAYLHHLVKAKEPLAASLLTIHNVHHMNAMMAGLRRQILADEI